MAENHKPPVPDLATVLRTLAALAPAGAQQPTQPTATTYAQPLSGQVYSTSQSYQPPHDLSSLIQPRAAYSFGSVEHHQPTPQHRHSFQDLDRNSSTPPLIDPATITQWPEGLRCVSKIASQNPHFKGAIRKLMADQESHERAWWRGRQILMKEQAAKKGHIGNHVPTWSSAAGSNEATSEAVEADEVELKEYDKKVYRASREMVNVMSLELKRLGVPFFGMKPELILPSGTEEPAVQQKPSVRPGTASGPKITEEEMLGLQRRMLGYLEDMYRER